MRAGSRLRHIGWAMVLTICVSAFLALTFQVNTVKSKVRLAERHIVSLEREKLLLETEFETRASQQQLADWNRIEYGYQAPHADQYLENERQLAALGQPRAVGAPSPIRVAHAPEAEPDGLIAMVSPLTGEPVQAKEPPAAPRKQADRKNRHNELSTGSLAERLAREVPQGGPSAELGR